MKSVYSSLYLEGTWWSTANMSEDLGWHET